MKRRRELGPLRDAEVLPFRELLLQREQLLRGERRPRLPVRLVFPQVALDLGRLAVLCNRKRVPLEDHPSSSLSFIAAHEPTSAWGQRASDPCFNGLERRPRSRTLFRARPQRPVFAAVLDPARAPARTATVFFFFHGRRGVQFIIFPPERRRKLASLPFCRPDRRIPAANRLPANAYRL